MVIDVAAAAAAARRTHDTLCRVGVVDQGKIGAIEVTLAGVHDDAIALQLQVEAAYDMMCKVAAAPPTHPHPIALANTYQLPPPPSLQVQLKSLIARASGKTLCVLCCVARVNVCV